MEGDQIGRGTELEFAQYLGVVHHLGDGAYVVALSNTYQVTDFSKLSTLFLFMPHGYRN